MTEITATYEEKSYGNVLSIEGDIPKDVVYHLANQGPDTFSPKESSHEAYVRFKVKNREQCSDLVERLNKSLKEFDCQIKLKS